MPGATPRLKRHLDHPWAVSPQAAREIQASFADRVETADRVGTVRTVAGVDVGFEADRRVTRAAVALLGYPGLELIDHAVSRRPTQFPYVPGLLSFREVPAVVAALEGLGTLPDLIICDGQGYAHPRRFGLACHLGVLLDVPSIGAAKTRLLGDHDPVPRTKGAWVELTDGGEVIGAVLRTRTGVKPLFVSIGHRLSLASAIALVLGCVTRFRLPETTRWAHRLASTELGARL
jgi:deoxyribonuclease V